MKMIGYEKEKIVMGYLISYYRNQSGISVRDLLKNNEICSNNTYYKIISGRAVDYEDIYVALISRLNKNVIFDNSIFAKIDDIRKLLYVNLTDFNDNHLKQLKKRIAQIKVKYVNVLYIEETLSIFEAIIDFEVSRVVPDHQIIYLCLFLRKFEFEDQKFVYYLLRKITGRSSEVKNSNVIEEVKNLIEDDLFFPYRLAIFQKSNNYDSLHQLLAYGKEHLKQFNTYQRYIYYDTLANYQLNQEGYDDAMKSLEECDKLISQNDCFSFYHKLDTKKHLAIVSFFNKDYINAEKYFDEITQLDPFTIGFNYLMYCYSLEKNCHTERILAILPDYHNQQLRNEVRKIIMYYRQKYSMNLKDKNNVSYLENFILEDLLPCVPFDSIYTEILKDNLIEFVSYSNNYKKIYLFDSYGKRE